MKTNTRLSEVETFLDDMENTPELMKKLWKKCRQSYDWDQEVRASQWARAYLTQIRRGKNLLLLLYFAVMALIVLIGSYLPRIHTNEASGWFIVGLLLAVAAIISVTLSWNRKFLNDERYAFGEWSRQTRMSSQMLWDAESFYRAIELAPLFLPHGEADLMFLTRNKLREVGEHLAVAQKHSPTSDVTGKMNIAFDALYYSAEKFALVKKDTLSEYMPQAKPVASIPAN